MLLRPATLALAAALGVAAPAAAFADSVPVAAEHVKAPAQPASSAQDSKSYAQREAQDQKAADYKGGDLLIVGASGGAILVVLLLLLILI
jgi:hypothetical protein